MRGPYAAIHADRAIDLIAHLINNIDEDSITNVVDFNVKLVHDDYQGSSSL